MRVAEEVAFTPRLGTAAVAASAVLVLVLPRPALPVFALGPNLLVTGSLSAVLWWQVARANDAQPSIVRHTKVGIVLVPLTIAASLLVLTRV